ncbi:MAG: TonB-dependent receptor [Candidatus Marinimicrobia bacterium]|nr:TonB-dependent receptor [bacterium]MCG2715152.1 TonB-dependent receptor [Candidatus Neomarinimicrobiota bacterium]
MIPSGKWHVTGLYLLFVLISGISLESIAQVPKGKIAGRVINTKTQEPLIGANIIIDGSTLGAAADRFGEYFVLNVPPGIYNITARMMGYRSMTVQQVVVVVDRTVNVNFSLLPTAIEMEPVSVVAKRPPVIKDLTSTANLIEARDIEAAPIEGLRQVLELNAGLTRNPNGTISIRGGPAFDIKFQINGVEQITSNTGIPGFNLFGEKSNTSWKYDFNPIGIKQLEVVSGGFSAEYGNAQSGIVKVVTKEGTDEFHGEFRAEVRPPGKYHFGPYIYGNETIEWQNWGTFDKWQNWRNDNSPDITDDSLRTYYYDKWIANHSPGPGNTSNLLGVYDYKKLIYKRYLFGLGGPLGYGNKLRFYFSGEYRDKPLRIPSAERSQKYQNYNLNVTYNFTDADKFRLMLQYQGHHGSVWAGSDDIRWASRLGQSPIRKYYIVLDSPKDEVTTTQSFSWTHIRSANTFFELMLWRQRERCIQSNLPVINPDDPWFVPANSKYWDEGFYREPWAFTTLSALDARTDVYNASFDITSQVTSRHQLKGGVKGQYWDALYNGESGARINAFVSYSGFAEYYHAYPFSLSAYIQDKIEFEGIVTNIGLRLDGYNLNMDVPVDRFRPFYQGTGMGGGPYVGDVGNPETKSTKTHVTLSPRFGMSFPVGEQTAFRIQYGHFYSMPIFRHTLSRTTWQGWYMYGNPDMGPKKTISYEVGVQRSLGYTHRLDMVAYFNDRVNQPVSVRVRSASGSQQVAPQNPYYVSYENNSYGASRGIEISLNKVDPGFWNYSLSYSFSRTSQGSYGAIDIYEDPDDPRSSVERRSANDFIIEQDRTHSFRSLVSYRISKETWENITGFSPFEDITLSLIYTAKTGTPFTYVTNYDEFTDIVNNRRYPLEARTDFNLSTYISLFDKRLLLSMRIMNLFNNKWLTPMSSQEQLKNWVEQGITRNTPPATGDSNDPQANIYKLWYYQTYRNIPREIYFTIGYNF